MSGHILTQFLGIPSSLRLGGDSGDDDLPGRFGEFADRYKRILQGFVGDRLQIASEAGDKVDNPGDAAAQAGRFAFYDYVVIDLPESPPGHEPPQESAIVPRRQFSFMRCSCIFYLGDLGGYASARSSLRVMHAVDAFLLGIVVNRNQRLRPLELEKKLVRFTLF